MRKPIAAALILCASLSGGCAVGDWLYGQPTDAAGQPTGEPSNATKVATGAAVVNPQIGLIAATLLGVGALFWKPKSERKSSV